MPTDILRIFGAGLLMLAGATGYQAVSCILRWSLGDVVLGSMAGVLAWWLLGLGMKMI